MPQIESEAPVRYLTSKAAYKAALMASPIFLIFACFGKWEAGLGPTICATLVLAIVRSHWDLRRSPWFWVSVAGVAALQTPFILMVPWSDRRFTGFSLLPVGIVDYGIMLGCFRLVEKRSKRGDERST